MVRSESARRAQERPNSVERAVAPVGSFWDRRPAPDEPQSAVKLGREAGRWPPLDEAYAAAGRRALAQATTLDQFRRIDLFDKLPDETLRLIASRAIVHSWAAHSQILSVRDQSNDVFFILRGRLQIKNYSQRGREFIFSEIGAGQIFGEFAALDGLPRSASVEAMEDSVVARMKAVDFVSLLRSDFELTMRLLRLLTAKSRGLSDRLFELIALNARDRICFELARLAQNGTEDGSSIMIRPAPTHYELAARIGSHREAVTRELNQLVSLGHLRLGRRHIVIVDMTRFTKELLAASSM